MTNEPRPAAGPAADLETQSRQADRPTVPPASKLLQVFRERCKAGEPISVESFLAEHPEARQDQEIILDLIYAEFILLRERDPNLDVSAFLGRFPGQEDRLRALLSLDRALWPDAPDGEKTEERRREAAPATPRQTIGKYPIVTGLGKGGQAEVYRAVHPTLQKDVVIKISRFNFEGSTAERDNLVQEGQLLARLDQSNVAQVFDLDFHEGRVFLVMEYVAGRTFAQWVEQDKPAPAQIARALAEAARALTAAHSLGISHCDLTPRNILIDERGQAKVIDFGLARFRHAWEEQPGETDTVSGTLPYLSPEQARGAAQEIGPRTDLFALGAVLYFALTGRPLYQGTDMPAVLERARRCEFDRAPLDAADVPAGLRAICLRLLQADPAQRYASATALAEALEAFVRPPWWQRRRLQAVAASLLVVGLLVLWWFLPGPSPHSTPDTPDKPTPPARMVVDDRKPRLTLRVFDDGRFFTFPNPGPLRTGQEVYIQAKAPPGLHVSLFLFTSDGVLKRLIDWKPEKEETTHRFPPDKDGQVALEGKPGTELLLLLGRESGPVSLEEVREWWGKAEAWPMLPGDSGFRMLRQDVLPLEKKRDIGELRTKRDDPEADVVNALDGLRGRLRERVEFFEGLAFSHAK